MSTSCALNERIHVRFMVFRKYSTDVSHYYIKSNKWKSFSRVWLYDSIWLDSPWNSPGQNTGVDRGSLLQGIFPTQGLNPSLLHGRWILYHWDTWEAPPTLTPPPPQKQQTPMLNRVAEKLCREFKEEKKRQEDNIWSVLPRSSHFWWKN